MAQRLPLRPLLFVAAGAMALTACGGAFAARDLAQAPAWFRERQKELAGQDYPSLTSVPPAPSRPGDAARWAKVEQELRAVGAAVNASPRAQPAPAADNEADAFDRAAREAIDKARPNAGASAAEPARPQ